ncbi:helix-turn-helix domain-containing protein [Hoeflea prorocentri]|uniref:XRE family transcriptional regulator n=1 Tax=Hoeflea prorocentri TaxID=1922333 RepID=A0A9X3ZG62_9HYPH|nr:XRE family transcriptional regulator [Hoeflea prorocentri]MCY6379859.1 XRE family transcriptional regulator [Hoeflea prorocentri]MDA5397659.1 XRE family transcriptional regulator [Hoeflea prorocentri]
MSGREAAKSTDKSEHGALAARLRERRRELGMTLKAVADAAGLSVGFISQIERGIAVPSLSSLVSVSRVLGVEVADFLTGQPKPQEYEAPTRQADRLAFAVSESAVTYERISSSFPGHVLRSVIIHEPPGHRGEPIAHEGEELMFVLAGAVTIEVDGERTILGTGDSMHFPSTRVHSTWNHSDTPATILWAGTMDVFGEDPVTPFHKDKKQKAD